MKLKVILYLACMMMAAALVGCGNEKEELDSQLELADTTAPATEEETEDPTAETEESTQPVTETTAAETETTAAAETTTTEVTEVTETEAVTDAPIETQAVVEVPDVIVTQPPIIEPEPVVVETEAPAVPEPDPAPAAGFTAEDLAFTCNGTSLTVGQDAAGFVAAVPADTVESAPSCYGDGNDINYYYSNFTLYIWDSNGTQLTYGIDITGAGLTTSKGIGIGSTAADVTAAYGSGYTVEGPDYVYAVDNCNLRFTISDDTVVYISYNYNL